MSGPGMGARPGSVLPPPFCLHAPLLGERRKTPLLRMQLPASVPLDFSPLEPGSGKWRGGSQEVGRSLCWAHSEVKKSCLLTLFSLHHPPPLAPVLNLTKRSP